MSEHYASIQGEGPRTGKLTQFIRFAGCNMRCPGWPCDTPHAIFPDQILQLSTKSDAQTIFEHAKAQPGQNICLTGGEPFVQPEEHLQELVELLRGDHYSIECFTNGSFIFPEWSMHSMTFMMDWKLEGSGEADTNRMERQANALRLRPSDGIKFVVTGLEDLREAVATYNQLRDGCSAQFWVGAAWGTITNEWLVDQMLALNLPWRLNLQTHKYIWDPEKVGV